MKWNSSIAWILTSVLAFGQTGPGSSGQEGRNASAGAEIQGSISGVIADSVSGAPISGAQIIAVVLQGERPGGAGERVNAEADAAGRYKLSGLFPGKYRIFVRSASRLGPQGAKIVSVIPGAHLTSIDFSLRPYGVISGRVLDDNGEPLPEVAVYAVLKQYHYGELTYLVKVGVKTDDRGVYSMPMLEPGQAYLLRAEKRDPQPFSGAPADFKRRKPMLVRTYYPNSDSIDTAAPLILRVGERREGVDISMARRPAYCIEGSLEVDGRPAALSFSIIEKALSASDYKLGGKAGPDGRIRICGLQPDEYQITAHQDGPPSAYTPPRFGTSDAYLADKDLRDVRVEAHPGVPLPGKVVWEGLEADQPKGKVSISLEPIRRMSFMGEHTDAESFVPGEFALPSLIADDYVVRVGKTSSPRVYVKDILYAGRSVRNKALRLGTAMGNATGLRIILGGDGGRFSASVIDEDRNPVPNSYVVSMPQDAASDAELAAVLISGQTDQTGGYASDSLTPGKYYVLAIAAPIDPTPESIGALLRARTSKAREIEISAGGMAQLTLPITSID
jgi:carboxypeptidase family protein